MTAPAEAASAARELIERGAGQVVVTLGAEGRSPATGDPPGTSLAAGRGSYPVGSGDAFIAGLAIGLVAGSSWSPRPAAAWPPGSPTPSCPAPGSSDAEVAARLLDEVSVSKL